MQMNLQVYCKCTTSKLSNHFAVYELELLSKRQILTFKHLSELLV